MDYQIKKDFLSKISESGKVSWQIQNEAGAYASSTLSGMNTSRMHGLFCVPEVDGRRKLNLLSKLEESVFVDHHLHEISTNRYQENIFPDGYRYLEEVRFNPYPTFIFRINQQRLQKTVLLLWDRNMLAVRYELCDQDRPVTLVVKPFLSFRGTRELLTNVRGFNTDSYIGSNFVRWAPRAGMTALNALFTNGEYVTSTLWYHKFFYESDKGKFDRNSEDLFNPGFFKIVLQPYQSVEFYFSNEEIDGESFRFDEILRRETERRPDIRMNHFLEDAHKKKFEKACMAVHQRVGKEKEYVLSNWKSDVTMREYLFSLPGLYLASSQFMKAEEILDSLLGQTDRGILKEMYRSETDFAEFKSPDLSLWLIIIIYQYLSISGKVEFLTKQRIDALRQIVELYQKGTDLNIHMDRDGLLFCGQDGMDMGWLDAFEQGPQTMGYGKLLHLNALWYCVLMVMYKIFLLLSKKRQAKKYQKMAEQTKQAFNEKFVDSENSRFFEIISQNKSGREITISQILPFALPFNPLNEDMHEPFFLNVVRLLVSSYGVSPAVNIESEDKLNRVIWPWANMFYFMGLKNMGIPTEKIEEKFELFQNRIDSVMHNGMVGFVPEAVKLEKEAIHQMGAPDYSLAAAAYLWSYFLVTDPGVASRWTVKE